LAEVGEGDSSWMHDITDFVNEMNTCILFRATKKDENCRWTQAFTTFKWMAYSIQEWMCQMPSADMHPK
jgi:hypothetical protein